jgi:hypothetical protein
MIAKYLFPMDDIGCGPAELAANPRDAVRRRTIDRCRHDRIRLRHYTNLTGWKLIKNELLLRAYDRGRVFAVNASVGYAPHDITEKYLMKPGRGYYYVEFWADKNEWNETIGSKSHRIEYEHWGNFSLVGTYPVFGENR